MQKRILEECFWHSCSSLSDSTGGASTPLASSLEYGGKKVLLLTTSLIMQMYKFILQMNWACVFFPVCFIKYVGPITLLKGILRYAEGILAFLQRPEHNLTFVLQLGA